MKIVLDTNVLFAAFTSHGLCEAVYEACLIRHEIVVCDQILEELGRHLPRVAMVSVKHAQAIVGLIRSRAVTVVPATIPQDSCRDADDLPVLGALIAADADCLVTGDGDLLTLGEFRGKPILSPRGLHDLISKQGE